jgi:putative tricarboxylic transport membrane protein
MSMETEDEPVTVESVWPQPASLRRAHQIAGGVLLALGVFVIWQALSLRYYTSIGPGPGFFSFWLGVMLTLLSLAMIGVATWRDREPLPQPMFTDRRGYLGIASVIASLLCAGLLMRPLGYPLTMLLIMFVMLRIGGGSWLVTIIGSLLGSFGLYYVFIHWLRVPLPAGLIGF